MKSLAEPWEPASTWRAVSAAVLSVPPAMKLVPAMATFLVTAMHMDHGLVYGGSYYTAQNCAALLSVARRLSEDSKEATLDSGWIRSKLLSILGHTNFAAPAEVRHETYLRMVRHAAAGELTVDFEVMPLERVAEAWERQGASPGRKLVLSPSGVP